MQMLALILEKNLSHVSRLQEKVGHKALENSLHLKSLALDNLKKSGTIIQRQTFSFGKSGAGLSVPA